MVKLQAVNKIFYLPLAVKGLTTEMRLKMIKNALYFILTVLSILDILHFLS